MTRRPTWDAAFAGTFKLDQLDGADDLTARQDQWRAEFSRRLYGPIPDPPDEICYELHELTDNSAHRLMITVTRGEQTFKTDAALWLPRGGRPAPLIAGLSFTGPIGIFEDDTFPIDALARIYTPPALGTSPELGTSPGRLHENLRGTEAHRWPVKDLTERGFAVLVSCYGSWVPDDPAAFKTQGLRPFLGVDTGAISLWAWALQRLVDVGVALPTVDTDRITVAGHSRLGKAALWAAANDARIGTIFANNAGCGGTAPAAHQVGETLSGMATEFPHWLQGKPDPSPLDQHHLMGCIAPRKLYVASADRDLWADPVGTYEALSAAATLWPDPMEWPSSETMWCAPNNIHHPFVGHHLRSGEHEMLPEDWRAFLAFLNA